MGQFLSTWAVPKNAIEVAAAAMAVLAATFCVLSASNTAQEKTKFWQRTRFQALLWLFVGGVSTLVVDWNALKWFENFDKPHLIGVYFVWVVGAGAVVFACAMSWIVTDATLLRDAEHLRHATGSMIVRFVVDGWSAYERERERRLDDARERAQQAARAQAEAADRTALVITSLALRVLGALSGADSAARMLLVDQIMQVIHAETVKFAPEPKPTLRLNYMIAIPWRRVQEFPNFMWQTLYEIKSDAQYGHMLDLRYRMQDGQREPTGPPIRIPVHDLVSNPELILPGAPEVLATGEAKLISRNARGDLIVDFRAGIPESDRREVRRRLQGLWFRGLLTLRLDTHHRAIGVLNIESSKPDLIGRRPEGVENLARMLKSLCQILAYVVEKEHENELG